MDSWLEGYGHAPARHLMAHCDSSWLGLVARAGTVTLLRSVTSRRSLDGGGRREAGGQECQTQKTPDGAGAWCDPTGSKESEEC